MDTTKRRRLEDAGWRAGSVQDFLDLTDEEREAIESRYAKEGREKE